MKRSISIIIGLAFSLSTACEREPSSTKPTVDRFQCARCHVIDGEPRPHPNLDCTGCHQALFGDESGYPKADVLQWRKNIRHFRLTPTLRGVDRLQRSWFESFVRAPHDVRPGLSEQMPRLAISVADASKLADELGLRTSAAAPAVGDAARGRELYLSYACASCHSFGGSDAPSGPAFERAAPAQERLAPDLRFARERLSRATVLSWLERPTDVKPDALMTLVVPDASDRRDLTAYLIDTQLQPVHRPAPPPLPRPLDRDVSWEEVNTAIFHATCRHCHTDGGPALPGEGGAGNTGGFGYAGKGLVLSSFEGARRGSASGDVFAPGADGVAPIVRHLMARHAEVAGQPMVGTLGMPLGLPPVALEDIALLRTWIAQGSKR